MSDERRQLTIRVEINCAEEAPWIWESHKQLILQGRKAAPMMNGVLVTGISDCDLIAENHRLEEKLSEYEEKFGTLYDGETIEERNEDPA